MKEMVGGCCVCSDERGWPENPLVYCDGQNCTVAVHQACYGIVTVPTGPWYCRKCESQERPTRVRCELCPSRDGALKKTDSQGWAHVVCALYIPEVRFGNVTTMEPIILQLIPPERYAKTCYICHEIGKPNRATVGACMQCNKSGCKQQFHVTCAQGLGLLCEEAGNYLDNVKYCGYCQHHYSKLKKGGNVKPIPPYKPITHDSSGSDPGSSPEKEIEPSLPPPAPTLTASASSTSATSIKITTNQSAAASVQSSTSTSTSSSSTSTSKQRKSAGTSKQSGSSSSSSSSSSSQSGSNLPNNTTVSNSGVANIASSAAGGSGAGGGGGGNGAGTNSNAGNSVKAISSSSSSNSSKDKEKHSKSVNKTSSSTKDKDKDKEKSSKSSKNKDFNDHAASSVGSLMNSNSSSVSATTGSLAARDISSQKFTNFNETSVINSTDIIFGSNSNSDGGAMNVSSSKSSNSSTNPKKRKAADSIKANSANVDVVEMNNSFRDIIKDVTVTLIPLPLEKPDNEAEKSSSKRPKTEISTSPNQTVEPNIQNVSPNLMPGLKQQQQLQTTSTTSNGTNGSTTGHHKSVTPKDQDDRLLRSASPYTTAAATTTTIPGNTTPSLYVSVPLSNANVPGINLPTTTTIATDQPLPTHLSRSNSISQSSGVVERQSPRIHHQNQMAATSTINIDHNSMNSTGLLPSTSSVIHQSRSSPSPSTLAGGNLTATTTESGMLKISYEKQVPRVMQLQEQESAPARRSRSQSGENSSSTAKSSSRSGKKRSSANVVLNTTTTTTTPTTLAAVSGNNATMPVGSSTAIERPPSSSSASSAASVKMPTTTSTTTSSANPTKSNPTDYPMPNSVPPPPKTPSPSANKQSSSATPPSVPSTSSSTSHAINSNSKSNSSSSETASNSNTSSKPLNKKLLRAQQTHYQQQIISQQPQLQLQQQTPPAQPPQQILINSDESTNIPNNSRTPDSGIFPSSNMSATSSHSTQSSYNNGGGLKFTYESQIPGPSVGGLPPSTSCSPPSIDTHLPPVVKDSPPSSPSSETSSARKRGRKSSDTTDVKIFQNGGIHATHMLGNQLNTASCVSQKLTDQLRMEIQDHSIFTQVQDNIPPMMGVPFPGRHTTRLPATQSVNSGAPSLTSMLGGGSGGSSNGPQSLEQLLERQWEQGSQFLMEQAQHFDIASLLSCLHQLRTENVRLEEHVTSLIQRRDHLLAVNARLAIPLTANLPQNQANLNNIHMNGPVAPADGPLPIAANPPTPSSVPQQQPPPPSRIPRANAQQQHYSTPQSQSQVTIAPIENGVDFRHSSAGHPSVAASALRHSNYSSSTSSSSSTHHSNHHSVLSSTTSATSSSVSRQQQHHQQPPPPPSHHHHHHPHPQQPPQHHHHHPQQPQQHHHHHHPSADPSALSRSDPHMSIRSSRAGNSVGGGSNPSGMVAGGLIGGPNGRGAHVDGPSSSSYHNAYSNVHQSQLRREDGPGKPS